MKTQGVGRLPLMLALVLGLAVLLLMGYVGSQVAQAPRVQGLAHGEAIEPSVLLTADGKTLMRFQREQRRPVALHQVSGHVVEALIATEDHRFYQHHGIDPLRLLKAVYRTATGRTEGGSTITQQLARNLYPEQIGRARNVNRKVKEIITALRIERVYDKRQILETYLNTAPFLYNVSGIEMAARTYFDKRAIDLDVAESATLIGMLKGTYYYNPVLHPERARERRNLVMAQMVRRGMLPQAEFERLREQPVVLRFNRQPDELGRAPHFAMHVRKWLMDWAEANDRDVYRDGLVVETTLDSRLQEAAAEAVARQGEALQRVADVEWSSASLSVASRSPGAYAGAASRRARFGYFWQRHPELLADAVRDSEAYREAVGKGADPAKTLSGLLRDDAFMARIKEAKTRLEAGLVALDPHTGEVKAWVGSRDFDQDQFDHVAQATRQPGSTFKPIVYAAALEQGMSPARTYADLPVEVPLPDGTVWRPTNMSGFSGRTMTLWEGLVYSKNTITTRVMQDVGLFNVASLAQAMGVDGRRLDHVPSMALGTSPVTLLEMATVYATIASGGDHRAPLTVRRIRDRRGQVLEEFSSEPRRALSFGTAMSLIDMMRGVVSHGTAGLVRTNFEVQGDLAGKTGTTQNNTDGWFIAMHPQLVVGAWVGFNDQRVTMRSDYWGQGGHNALRVVGDMLQSSMKARRLEASAVFPTPQRPPITAAVYARAPYGFDLNEGETPPDPLVEDPANMASASASTSQGGIIVIHAASSAAEPGRQGTPASQAVAGAPRSDEELGRILGGMGLDPNTGAPPGSGPGASGARLSPPPPAPVIPRSERSGASGVVEVSAAPAAARHAGAAGLIDAMPAAPTGTPGAEPRQGLDDLIGPRER